MAQTEYTTTRPWHKFVKPKKALLNHKTSSNNTDASKINQIIASSSQLENLEPKILSNVKLQNQKTDL